MEAKRRAWRQKRTDLRRILISHINYFQRLVLSCLETGTLHYPQAGVIGSAIVTYE